ncbi:nuclease-related domain-containing protein [Oecophyllibacter saccharovorans]|uniref:nuclease-related domain-containing protein n=1 Tax=Oecophyllibacter saccharovorans TaxID=2558360 RepID=UPI00116C2F5F|nr:nuclease-related domain-containing protein [Oecophyllibacter saccharovorans]TPW35100.1 NERD domain-containing protein [Oecophyllibacter saccharovorans]
MSYVLNGFLLLLGLWFAHGVLQKVAQRRRAFQSRRAEKPLSDPQPCKKPSGPAPTSARKSSPAQVPKAKRPALAGRTGRPAFPPEKTAEEKGKRGEARINATLRQFRRAYLHDIILMQDGHTTQIDHVVKFCWGLVVIETKHYSGHITQKSPEPGKWKQTFPSHSIPNTASSRPAGSVLSPPRRRERLSLSSAGRLSSGPSGTGKAKKGHNSFLFQDPVVQNARHVAAVRAASGLAENVLSLVVFTGQATFSKTLRDMQDVVDQAGFIARMEQWLQRAPRTVPWLPKEQLDAGWARLQRCAKANHHLHAAHKAQLRERQGS